MKIEKRNCGTCKFNNTPSDKEPCVSCDAMYKNWKKFEETKTKNPKVYHDKGRRMKRLVLDFYEDDLEMVIRKLRSIGITVNMYDTEDIEVNVPKRSEMLRLIKLQKELKELKKWRDEND